MRRVLCWLELHRWERRWERFTVGGTLEHGFTYHWRVCKRCGSRRAGW